VNRYQVGNSNRYEAGQQEILKNGSAAQSGSLNQYATSGQQQQVQQYQVSCMRRLPSIFRAHQGAILGNSLRISNLFIRVFVTVGIDYEFIPRIINIFKRKLF